MKSNLLKVEIKPIKSEEKVVFTSISYNDDHPSRKIDTTDMDMDMDMKLEVEKYEDLSRKQILCPICRSNCPSRRFSEFSLRQKDPSPTTLPFQENPKPPLPETPKLMYKIHKYMIRTPQVKRKALEDSEFLELEMQKTPPPHPPKLQNQCIKFTSI